MVVRLLRRGYFTIKPFDTAMKISKSLLQAILAGVTLGATATSCDTIKKDFEIQEAVDKCDNPDVNRNTNPQTPDPFYNCPACGMG